MELIKKFGNKPKYKLKKTKKKPIKNSRLDKSE